VQAPWGAVLQCSQLLPYAPHFFTAASLQLKNRPDEWAAVAQYAGVAPESLLLLRQVHGKHIVTVRRGREGRWELPEADGILSSDPASAVVVRVADCAPILLADRRLGVVAAVHAGWRSTMQRIVEAAVTTMREQFQTDPADLVAAIGPSLGECCGEMGEEVVQAFRDSGHAEEQLSRWFTRAPGKRPHFDLWGANRDQLEDAGVTPEAIHVAALCTRTFNDVFHSYRAAGPNTGRMAAVIRRR
jgi:polyphenol oxidase